MTREELQAKFPNASEAFFQANSDDFPRRTISHPSPNEQQPMQMRPAVQARPEKLSGVSCGGGTKDSPAAPSPALTPRLRSRRARTVAQPQRPAGQEPLGAGQDEAGRAGRHLVRVTSFRVNLLDEDNLIAKWHVDALRYAGILHSDAPGQTHIEVGQKKVASFKQERVVIEIFNPHTP